VFGSFAIDVAFLPDDRHAVSGVGRGGVVVWDTYTGKEVAESGMHKFPSSSLAVTPDGDILSGLAWYKRHTPINNETLKEDFAIRVWRLPKSVSSRVGQATNAKSLQSSKKRSETDETSAAKKPSAGPPQQLDPAKFGLEIHEAGWTLTQAVPCFDAPYPAIFHPISRRLYFGDHHEEGWRLHCVEPDGTTRLVFTVDDRYTTSRDDHRPGASKGCFAFSPRGRQLLVCEGVASSQIVQLDAETGEIVHALDPTPGEDDDPVGIAFPPTGWSGSQLGREQALAVDTGHKGPSRLCRLSLDGGQPERIGKNVEELSGPVDVTITKSGVYVINSAPFTDRLLESEDDLLRRIWRLVDDTLVPIQTDRPILDPSGIAFDPLTSNPLVLCGYRSIDRKTAKVFRVRRDAEKDIHRVTDVFGGFKQPALCGIDVSPDGVRIAITDLGAKTIYVFSRAGTVGQAAKSQTIPMPPRAVPKEPAPTTAPSVAPLELVRTLEGHESRVESIDVSSDGRLAVSGGDDGTVRLWDIQTGDTRHVFDVGSCAVDLSPDGRFVAAGTGVGRVSIWDLKTYAEYRKLQEGTGAVAGLCFSPDSRFILAATRGSNGMLRYWDVEGGKALYSFPLGVEIKSHCGTKITSDGRFGVVYPRLQHPAIVYVFDLQAGKELRRFEVAGGGKSTGSIAVSSDGSTMLVSRYENTAVCDLVTGAVKRLFGSISENVAFLPDDRHAVCGESKGAISVWDTLTGHKVAVSSRQKYASCGLAVTPDGNIILSGRSAYGNQPPPNNKTLKEDFAIRVWRLPKGVLSKPKPPAATQPPSEGERPKTGDGSARRKPDRHADVVPGLVPRPAEQPDRPDPAEFGLCIHEPGWILTRVVHVPEATYAAGFHPVTGHLYYGSETKQAKSFVCVETDGTTRVVCNAAGMCFGFSPNGSQLLVSNMSDLIVQIDMTTGEPVRTFDLKPNADDDPAGIAFPPPGWTGTALSRQQALCLDLGFKGACGLWRLSLDGSMPEQIAKNARELVDPVDVAITRSEIYVTSRDGKRLGTGNASQNGENEVCRGIFRLDGDTLVPIRTDRPIFEPRGISFDPISSDLLVRCGYDPKDPKTKAVLRLHRDEGAPTFHVTDVFSGFAAPVKCGIDVSPDGLSIAVTDPRTVYVLSRSEDVPTTD